MGAAGKQAMAASVGLALFAIAPKPAFFALLLAYAASVLLLSALDAQRWASLLPRPARIALFVLLASPGIAALARVRAELLDFEGLRALPALLSERVRLEAMPQIAPPLVSPAEPQRFFVHAAPHAQVRVRFGPRARVLAATELGQGLYRLDYDPRRDGPPSPSGGALTASIFVGRDETARTLHAVTPLAHPRWLARSPDGQLAASVSEETDELVVVSARGMARRIAVGDGPSDCAFVGANLVAVAHRDEPDVWIVDAQSGSRVARIAVGRGQHRLALSPDGSLLAVARAGAQPEVVLLRWPAAGLDTRIALEAAPDWIAFGPDASTLIVSSRSDAMLRRYRHENGTWRTDASLHLGRAAVTLGRSANGTRIYATTTDYRPAGPPNLGNHFVQDQILFIDVAAFAVQRVFLTARRSPRQSKPGDVDRGVSPMGMTEAHDGSLLVAFAGTDELWRLHEGAAEPDIIDLYDTPLHAPHGLCELADGTLVVASPSAGALGLVSFDHAPARVLRLAPDDDYLRQHDREALGRRLGEHGFYEATRSGISCQSCHMHADSDEAGHNLGTHRLLPTLGVRGLLGTAPYLRDGSFSSIGALDHVAQTLYRGYLRRAPGRAQTLDAFVSSLPRRRLIRDAAPDLERERRGLRVFSSAGCPTCHAFPAFTRLGQELVRSVFPERGARLPANEVLDTASLLSIAASPPYLSDGSARTLDAVLTEHNRSNRHGNTARISRSERADLVAFLESL